MSNTILPTSENLANLLGESGRSATMLSDLLKNNQNDTTQKNKTANHSLQDYFSPSIALQNTTLSEKASTQYAYSNTMTLSLTTKEGDKVTVDFRQLYAEYQAYEKQQGYDSSPQGSRYFDSTQQMESTAFEERFGFSVNGDLNDDEMKAITSVFQQVDSLANHFFHGNIEQAFQKAADLNVDFGQLQSVSLNLQQTQTYSANYQKAAAYQQQNSQAASDATQSDNNASVSALPAYLQKMQKVVDTLSSQFDNARQVAEQLLSNVVASRFPQEGTQSVILQRLQKLHDALVNQVPLSETTLAPSGVVISPNAAETAQAKDDSDSSAPSDEDGDVTSAKTSNA